MGEWEDYCEAFYGNRECDPEGRKVRKRSQSGGRQFLLPEDVEINTLRDMEALYGDEDKNMNVREEVHAKVKKFQMDHNEPSYKTALERVFWADPTLKQRYAESSPGQEIDEQELSKHKAGQTLKNLALQHQQRKGGSFVDALHAVAAICPGEIKAYLNLELPRRGKEVGELWFRDIAGWTEGGVRDWLEEQGIAGGELSRNDGGWSYVE